MMLSSRWIAVWVWLGLLALGATGCSKAARAGRYLEAANRDFKAGQYQKAEVEYLKVLQLNRQEPVAIRQLGLLYFLQGRLLAAHSFLKKAAELEPGNVEVRLRLGQTYLAGHESGQAREHALWVLGKKPGDREALLLLSDSALTPKEIQETQQRIEQLRRADAGRASYAVAMGALYLRAREYAKAEAEVGRALAVESNSSAGLLLLGNLRWARNDLAAAEKAIGSAAGLAEPRSLTRLKYADFKFKTGAVDDAEKAIQSIVRQVPDYLPAQVALAQVAMARKRYSEAEKTADQILAVDSANYDALLLKGSVGLAEASQAKALAAFERMGQFYPRSPQVSYQTALAHLLGQDIAKAATCLNQSLGLDPNYPEAILLQANLSLRKGDAAAAIPPLARLSKQQPELLAAQVLLAAANVARRTSTRRRPSIVG